METDADKARAGALSFSLEFTETVRTRPLVERLFQALKGRFLCFALISYISPQNSANIHAIYHMLARDPPAPGKRQVPFNAVETLLCYGLFSLVDPHRYGGANIG